MLLHDDADTINPMPKMISETLLIKFFIVSSLHIYCRYSLVPIQVIKFIWLNIRKKLPSAHFAL
jgi:hypothetical protein